MANHSLLVKQGLNTALGHFSKAHNATNDKKRKNHFHNGYSALTSANSSATQIKEKEHPFSDLGKILQKAKSGLSGSPSSNLIIDVCNAIVPYTKIQWN